jgi:hypothetical protein
LGNGIEASGSHITVQGVSLLRIYNQGISAGKGSVVRAKGIRAADVGTAIAGKDMSAVDVQDVRISQAWVAGFAAYREKYRYGSTTLHASRTVFEDDSVPALVQGGNRATVNDSAVAARTLDTSELDRRQGALARIRAVNYCLGSLVRLIGYDVIVPELRPGDPLELVLYWQALAKLNRDYTVFVHVVNASGQIAAQWDAMPRGNAFPTTHWPIGTAIDDPHQVPLPPSLPVGEYRIVLGMYHVQTGERLPVVGSDGESIPDAAIVLKRSIKVGRDENNSF